MRTTPTLLILSLLLVLTPAASCRADEATAKITVDPAKRYQTIDGWGTCLISWLPEMTALYEEDAFADYYVKELGANALRINLWPTVCPPAREPGDIDHNNFDFSGEGQRLRVFLDFAKKLRARDPDALLMGTVWSPPAWMKLNRDINDKASNAIGADSYKNKEGNRVYDNRLDMKYLPHFAAWVVEMAKLFEAEGVPLDAVSVANEPQFTQGFESCLWTADDWAAANRAVGEALDEAGLTRVKLFGPETMTGFNWPTANPLYLKHLKDDPALKSHFVAVATHGYLDGAKADTSAKSAWEFWQLAAPLGLPYWITEGGTGGHDWPEPVGGMAMCLHNALVHGNASAVVPWQLTERTPGHGALMHMRRPTKKTHVARQYWRYVRPGAVRVSATPGDSENGVAASAFVHDADATLTIVLVNTAAEARPVALTLPAGLESFETVVRTDADDSFKPQPTVSIEANAASLTLPGHSVTTLQGRYAAEAN